MRPLHDSAELQPLLSPRSVVIVGASARQGSFGWQTLANLERGGVRTLLVHPKGEPIEGRIAYRGVADLPEVPDCAVIAVARDAVLDVAMQCAAKGIRGALVYASGFAETGREQDIELQRALTRLAADSGMRILGPNTMGLISEQGRVRLSFFGGAPDLGEPRHSRIGLVSQSGGLGFALGQAAVHGHAFSHVLTTGNACDVDVADQVSYLVDQPDCDVIACVFEGMVEPARLMAAGEKALRAGKPVVVFKLATGSEGSIAAQSHTGSLAGSAEVYRAAFARHGFIEVHSFEAILETCAFLAKAGRPSSDGVAGLATSGGAAIMVADKAEQFGVRLPQPSEAVERELRRHIPEFGSARNPCDVTAQILANPQSLPACARAMLGQDDYSTLVMPHMTATEVGTKRLLDLGEVGRETGKMICCVWLSQWLDGPGAREVEQHDHLALFRSMDRCIQAIGAWHEFHRLRARREKSSGYEDPSASIDALRSLLDGHGPGVLSESQSKRILQACGVPTLAGANVNDRQAAVEAAARLGGPVVLKVDSPDIPHKTEAGAVRLNLRTAAEVADAYDEVMRNARAYAPDARIDGVSVQPMAGKDLELIVGARRDPMFGPVVVVGFGGILVELLQDTVLDLAPVSVADAHRMLDRLRGRRLLDGFRGSAPVDVDELARLISRISRLAHACADRIEEIDINPLAISKGRAMALDALVVLRERPKHQA